MQLLRLSRGSSAGAVAVAASRRRTLLQFYIAEVGVVVAAHDCLAAVLLAALHTPYKASAALQSVQLTNIALKAEQKALQDVVSKRRGSSLLKCDVSKCHLFALGVHCCAQRCVSFLYMFTLHLRLVELYQSHY